MDLLKIITFIVPPFSSTASAYPPLGPLYIVSALQNSNIECNIIDLSSRKLNPSSFDDISNSIKSEINKKEIVPRFFLIGPCISPVLEGALNCIKACKNLYPDSLIVIGGPHFHFFSFNDLLLFFDKHNEIDAVALGEADDSILEFFKLNQKSFLMSVPGVICRNNLDEKMFIIRTIYNLNELQFPGPVRLTAKRNQTPRRRTISPKETSHIIGSRGCVFNCSFCNSLKNRRTRTAANIYSEIMYCYHKLNVRHFIFFDDLFLTTAQEDLSRIEELCRLIINGKFSVLWQIELRADVAAKLSIQFLKLLALSGCRSINLGIERISNKDLKIISKGLTIDKIRSGIKRINEIGKFTISGTFIIDDQKDGFFKLIRTVLFAFSLNLDYTIFSSLKIYYGTPLERSERYPKSEINRAICYGGCLNQTDLKKWKTRLCYFIFYFLNPNRYFRKILTIYNYNSLNYVLKEYSHYLKISLGFKE